MTDEKIGDGLIDTTKSHHIWKKLFIGLLSLNLLFFTGLVILIYWPIQESELSFEYHHDNDDHSEFIIRTTKKELNNLMNAYLTKLVQGTNHRYEVILDDDVHLFGELPIFFTHVPISMRFSPIVQNNGDLILKQQSLSIGRLNLPYKNILALVKDHLPLPEWIIISPVDEEIYVAITQINFKSDFQIHVDQFDLMAHDLSFRINIPYETLGLN